MNIANKEKSIGQCDMCGYISCEDYIKEYREHIILLKKENQTLRNMFCNIDELIAAAKELANLYECAYGRGDEYCHNEAWGIDHLTSCPKLVAEKAIERVRKWL